MIDNFIRRVLLGLYGYSQDSQIKIWNTFTCRMVIKYQEGYNEIFWDTEVQEQVLPHTRAFLPDLAQHHSLGATDSLKPLSSPANRRSIWLSLSLSFSLCMYLPSTAGCLHVCLITTFSVLLNPHNKMLRPSDVLFALEVGTWNRAEASSHSLRPRCLDLKALASFYLLWSLVYTFFEQNGHS